MWHTSFDECQYKKNKNKEFDCNDKLPLNCVKIRCL